MVDVGVRVRGRGEPGPSLTRAWVLRGREELGIENWCDAGRTMPTVRGRSSDDEDRAIGKQHGVGPDALMGP